ncbi:hypothetical protein P7D52_09795 [Enterococcus dongliensis]|uniref:Uncharacterized protein n=1 Tax=Enterococcus dongliensis TaxID=2559925 RepID=A0AAP5TZW5_9ENTE|nr:hypothetical protein [Enterococcus dongliensis]MDT2597268.1 hypothetical protein [Enterococcus dongliensis]MDT2603978.1 hypothetical protein [Enterococcus dongliensis]MDT2613534.1 hypothetical protein [Enterococcus dongliensis]MDT2634902.1 hypothetical protein [Enterococcus dongliensis]MDT2638047.1 hypothetical protein [Enterococcus dongliensis]
MANTYGFKSPQPSFLGERFSIGQEVFFEYKKETQLGIVKNKLNNSAVVKIIKSETADLIDFTTVISYGDLVDPKTNF